LFKGQFITGDKLALLGGYFVLWKRWKYFTGEMRGCTVGAGGPTDQQFRSYSNLNGRVSFWTRKLFRSTDVKIGDEWCTFPQNSNSMMFVLKEVNFECAAQ